MWTFTMRDCQRRISRLLWFLSFMLPAGATDIMAEVEESYNCSHTRTHEIVARQTTMTKTVVLYNSGLGLGSVSSPAVDHQAQRNLTCSAWTVRTDHAHGMVRAVIQRLDLAQGEAFLVVSDRLNLDLTNLTDRDPFPKTFNSDLPLTFIWVKNGSTKHRGDKSQHFIFSYLTLPDKDLELEEKEQVVLIGAIVGGIVTVIATVVSVLRASKCRCCRWLCFMRKIPRTTNIRNSLAITTTTTTNSTHLRSQVDVEEARILMEFEVYRCDNGIGQRRSNDITRNTGGDGVDDDNDNHELESEMCQPGGCTRSSETSLTTTLYENSDVEDRTANNTDDNDDDHRCRSCGRMTTGRGEAGGTDNVPHDSIFSRYASVLGIFPETTSPSTVPSLSMSLNMTPSSSTTTCTTSLHPQVSSSSSGASSLSLSHHLGSRSTPIPWMSSRLRPTSSTQHSSQGAQHSPPWHYAPFDEPVRSVSQYSPSMTTSTSSSSQLPQASPVALNTATTTQFTRRESPPPPYNETPPPSYSYLFPERA